MKYEGKDFLDKESFKQMAKEVKGALSELDNSVDGLSDSLGVMQKAQKDSQEETKKSVKAIQEQARTMGTSTSKQREAMRGLVGELGTLSEKYNKATDEIKSLSDAQKKAQGTVDTLKDKFQQLLKSVSKLDMRTKNSKNHLASLSSEMNNLGNSAKGTSGAFNSLGKSVNSGGMAKMVKGGAIAGGVAGLAIAVADLAVDGLGALATSITKVNTELVVLQNLTGQIGNDSERNTAKIKTLAKAYGKDFNEVLTATNTLSKETGASFSDSLESIKIGFVQGADAGGEYLSTLKEYPTQLKSVGLSLEGINKVAIAQAKEGFVSDKFPDAIKEIALRLGDLTPAQKKIVDGFGESGKAIQDAFAESKIKGVSLLAQKIVELKKQGKEVQPIISNLGGGALEDLGQRGIEAIANIKNLSFELSSAQRKQIAHLSSIEDMNVGFEKLGSTIFNELNPAFRGATRETSKWVGAITEYLGQSIEDKVLNEQSSLVAMLSELNNANTSQQRRNDILSVLQKEYPSILKNLESEGINLGTITKNIDLANKAFVKKIALERLQGKEEKIRSELRDVTIEQLEGQEKLNKALARIKREFSIEDLRQIEAQKTYFDQAKKIFELEDNLSDKSKAKLEDLLELKNSIFGGERTGLGELLDDASTLGIEVASFRLGRAQKETAKFADENKDLLDILNAVNDVTPTETPIKTPIKKVATLNEKLAETKEVLEDIKEIEAIQPPVIIDDSDLSRTEDEGFDTELERLVNMELANKAIIEGLELEKEFVSLQDDTLKKKQSILDLEIEISKAKIDGLKLAKAEQIEIAKEERNLELLGRQRVKNVLDSKESEMAFEAGKQLLTNNSRIEKRIELEEKLIATTSGEDQAEAMKRKAELENKLATKQFLAKLGLVFVETYLSELKATPPAKSTDALKSAFKATALVGASQSLGIKAFEKGGLVEGGDQVVRINEKGQEYVINAKATKSSMNALQMINSGVLTDKNILPPTEMASQIAYIPQTQPMPQPTPIDYAKLGKALSDAMPTHDIIKDGESMKLVVDSANEKQILKIKSRLSKFNK
jgi:hypothetical protein